MTRVGRPLETTPNSFTTWWQSNALHTTSFNTSYCMYSVLVAPIFHQHQQNSCADIIIFQFLKWPLSAILDLLGTFWASALKVIGDLYQSAKFGSPYHRAKFGCKCCSSFYNVAGGPRIPFCERHPYVFLSNTSSQSVTFPHPAREPARPSRRPTASTSVSGRANSVNSFISVNIRPSDPVLGGVDWRAAAVGSSDLVSFPRKLEPTLVCHPTGPPPGEPDALTTSTETSTPWGIRDALIGRLPTAPRDVATSEVDSYP